MAAHFKTLTSKEVTIHNVWKENLNEEFVRIRQYIKEYPYIAFDTEFPGVVATPIGAFKTKEEFLYNQISCNVNILKLIQVGFCLVNSQGNLPPGGDIWQFNFQFSVNDDMYAVESVDLLKKSGIDFDKHQTHGIRVEDFGALLTTSGLVANDKVTWITFHSCFDFGYLIKSIVGPALPLTEKEYYNFHKILFPRSYDIKILMKCKNVQAAQLRGGLQDVANQLCVERIGNQHQAGSDSLLTAQTFFKLREKFFGGDTWERVAPELQGYMYGLGASKAASFFSIAGFSSAFFSSCIKL
uniref:poly(A)-specific ribonuclease n=1 Tax=Panagrolaimus superbus TaxID=310955 RepID=A0A914Y7P8_9BILA